MANDDQYDIITFQKALLNVPKSNATLKKEDNKA